MGIRIFMYNITLPKSLSKLERIFFYCVDSFCWHKFSLGCKVPQMAQIISRTTDGAYCVLAITVCGNFHFPLIAVLMVLVGADLTLPLKFVVRFSVFCLRLLVENRRITVIRPEILISCTRKARLVGTRCGELLRFSFLFTSAGVFQVSSISCVLAD